MTVQQARQPKGTSTGGQFAGSVNPESTLELAREPETPKRSIAEIEAVISMWEMRIEDLQEEYDAVVDTGSRREGDIDAAIDSSRIEISGLRDELIEAMREDRRRNPSLKQIVLMRAADRLSEQGTCAKCGLTEDDCPCEAPDVPSALAAEDIDLVALAADFDAYELENDRDWDGAFEGIDYVVESLIDWRIEQKEARK